MKNQESNVNNPPSKKGMWCVVTILTVWVFVILSAAAYWIPKYYIPTSNSGEFGDMFGAVNALFSGLAFLGVIVAILLQREELSLQRKELKDNRKELAGQKEQLELQNKTFRIQTFNNAFFQMLSFHNENINSIDVDYGNRQITGRDCFPIFHQKFHKYWNSKLEELRPLKQQPKAIDYESTFEKLYEEIRNDVGHYFRTLYNIIKFVDGSDVEDKQFYVNLVRAQLSSPELLLLFYNCTTKYGREKFKPLIERYALLKHMPIDSLFEQDHKNWYSQSAYGK